MIRFLNECLCQFDEENARPVVKVIGYILWCLIFAGFSISCAIFTIIFQ